MTRREGFSFRPLAELLIFLLLMTYIPFLLFMNPTDDGFLWGDAAYYRLALQSLVQHGDVSVAHSLSPNSLAAAVNEGQLAVGASGALVPKHQLLAALIAYPAYRVLGDKGLLLVNVGWTLVALVGVLALCRMWVSDVCALGVAFLFGVATLFFPYVYNFSADVLTTAFLVWGVVMTCKRHLFIAALLVALSVTAKLSSLPVAAGGVLLIACGAAREQTRWRHLAMASCGVALGLLPLLVMNALLFGGPLESGYAHIAVASATGTWVERSHTGDFTRPVLRGLWDVLFSFPKGLFVSNPLLLAVLAFPVAARSKRDPFLLLLLLCAAAQVFVIALYAYWDTSHFSNRFLMPAVALLAPHVAVVLEAGARKVVAEAR